MNIEDGLFTEKLRRRNELFLMYENQPDSTPLTYNTVMVYLGVGHATLHNWKKSGAFNLPYIKIGRKIWYRLGDVKAFLKKNTIYPEK